MKQISIIILIAIILNSCATIQFSMQQYSVEVTTIGESEINNKKIKTLLFDPIEKIPIDTNNLEMYQFKKMIDKILVSIGFEIAAEDDFDFDEVIIATVQIYVNGFDIYGNITYIRAITLESTDAKYFAATKNFKNIWFTKITSIGTSKDLNAVIPAILLSAKDYIAKETRGTKKYKIPITYETSLLYE